MNRYSQYLNKIHTVFKQEYYAIFGVYDMQGKYLFGIKNKKNINENPLDPWYTIEKDTYKIEGFAPHLNKTLFKQALTNEITESFGVNL